MADSHDYILDLIRNIGNHSSDGYTLIDENFNIVWVNNSLQDKGFKLEEIKNNSFFKVFNNKEEIDPDCSTIKAFKKENPEESINKGNDGKEYLVDSIPIKINDEVKYVLEISRQILKKEKDEIREKTAESKAEENEDLLNYKKKLEYILSSSRAVLYTSKLSEDFEATFVSRNIFLLTGFTSDEVLKNSGLWRKRIHPEDRKKASSQQQNIFTQGHTIYEYRFQNKDGEFVWLRDDRKLARNKEGQPIGIIGFWVDITRQKESEKELTKEKYFSELLINSLPGIFYLFDKDRKFKKWNRNFEKVTGYSREEISKISPLDLFEGEDQEIIADKIKNAFNNGQASAKAKIVNKKGEKNSYFFTSSLIKLENKEYIIGTGINIADREAVEKELEYRKNLENIIMKISTSFINLPVNHIDKGLTRALKTIGQFLNADRCFVFCFYDKRKKASNTHEWCNNESDSQIRNLQAISVQERFPWLINKIRMLESVNLKDLNDLPEEALIDKEFFKEQNIKSFCCVPMISRGNLIGFIGFNTIRRENHWSEETLNLLQILSEIVANLLDGKKKETEIKRRTEELEKFNRLAVGRELRMIELKKRIKELEESIKI